MSVSLIVIYVIAIVGLWLSVKYREHYQQQQKIFNFCDNSLNTAATSTIGMTSGVYETPEEVDYKHVVTKVQPDLEAASGMPFGALEKTNSTPSEYKSNRCCYKPRQVIKDGVLGNDKYLMQNPIDYSVSNYGATGCSF
jgi:hypothetical protein